MHTKINLSRSPGSVLRYHERKIKQGQAECLYAGNMLKDAEELTLKEKQAQLERRNALNERVRRKTLHIFLSWHQDDRLDNNKMRTIAKEYMRGMGLGDQPYLVYRHWDAVHNHAHIVTSNIRKDGTRIAMWRGELQHSLELSRQLEVKYGLYEAGHRMPDEEWARQHPVQKVVYGQTPLKPAMNAVLEAVIPSYKYTSLDELNAVLRAYNIRANRGKEDSIIRQNNGLIYIPLNERGEVEAMYIKASALRCKPTLRQLQQRFRANQALREECRQRLTTAIDWIFYKQAVSQEAFRQALQKEKISMVTDQDGRGPLQNIFYIDQSTRAVFDGRTLGRNYSADGINARCLSAEVYQQQIQQKQQQKQKLRQRPRLDHY